MKNKGFILAALLFVTAACKVQPAAPTFTATLSPTSTALPAATATPAPTETALPTPSDVFGAIPLNRVQACSSEPAAQAIFDQTLDGYVSAGTIREYRVDSISVFPSGDGGLIAEIMYGLRTDSDPWLEDGGIPGPDGWITGKCSRFDLAATETEHQLKNKRLCS